MDSRRQHHGTQQFPPLLQSQGGGPPRQHLPLPPPHLAMGGPRPSPFSGGPAPPLSGHKRSSTALYNRSADGPNFAKVFVGSLPRNISEEKHVPRINRVIPTYTDAESDHQRLLESLPGDNGFDPLGLGEDPANLKWYVQAELQNGRWAMLRVAGIGILNVPAWYDTGKADYFALASTLFVIEFIMFHYVEVRRWQDIKYPGSVNADPFNPKLTLPPGEVGYPGGIFNPLNFPTSLEYKEVGENRKVAGVFAILIG